MELLRTPDERFANLPGWSFAPHYADAGGPRVHYVDEGSGPPILLLHGEPSWSYLYRKMIPVLARKHRVIAPDLVGFGRSDKPSERADYTYQRHVDWMAAFIAAIDLRGATLFCQDWGGLIGLRLIAEHGDRFAAAIAANTFLPTGDRKPPDAFFAWRDLSQNIPEFPTGRIIRGGCVRNVPDDVVAAYDAPFPEERYKAGARQFPMLVPAAPDDPASAPNRAAWERLRQWKKPFVTMFSDKDPITAGADRFLQKEIPGAAGQPHTTIKDAGHFLQEDAGEEIAEQILHLKM